MMVRLLTYTAAAIYYLTFPVSAPLHWLVCRLSAKPCPHCGERRRTELMGEWGDEDWRCSVCRHWWIVPYPPDKYQPR